MEIKEPTVFTPDRDFCVKSESPPSLPCSRGIKREQSVSPIVKSESAYSVKSEETCYSLTTSPGLTTELENFQDLTEWCRRAPNTPKMSSSAENDELNTPVLELGEFMFTSPTTINHTADDYYGLLSVQNQDGTQSEFELELGTETADHLNNIQSETYQYTNVFIGGGEQNRTGKQTENITAFSSILNNNNSNNNNNNNNNRISNESNCNSHDNTSNDHHPNHFDQVFTQDNIVQSAMSQHHQTIDIFGTFPSSSSIPELQAETVVQLQDLICFPLEEDALQTTTNTTSVLNDKKNLRLDFSNIWIDNKQVLSTPEVINTALSLEKGFNLVNFITNENVTVEEISSSCVNSAEEDDNRSQCADPDPDPDPSYSPSEPPSDDDEDYEPPWKKQKTPSKSRLKSKKLLKIDSDSDISNCSTVESVKVARRGRPPKRNISISSESTADTEVSRYRELRDKNNEASRKSRLNRKLKEQQLEEEAKDLDVKNRKLKIRVQELERLVNTMRNNLMQMLLRK